MLHVYMCRGFHGAGVVQGFTCVHECTPRGFHGVVQGHLFTWCIVHGVVHGLHLFTWCVVQCFASWLSTSEF